MNLTSGGWNTAFCNHLFDIPQDDNGADRYVVSKCFVFHKDYSLKNLEWQVYCDQGDTVFITSRQHVTTANDKKFKEKINKIFKNEELWDGGTVRKAKNQ